MARPVSKSERRQVTIKMALHQIEQIPRGKISDVVELAIATILQFKSEGIEFQLLKNGRVEVKK